MFTLQQNLDIEYAYSKSNENCPFCGKNGKNIHIKLSDNIDLHDKIKVREKNQE